MERLGYWLRRGLLMILVIGLIQGFTSTYRGMAKLDVALKSGATVEEIESLSKPASQIFTSATVPTEYEFQNVKFWHPKTNQEVRHYAMEAMPCYFDMWLLVDTPTRKILDWRLFRLDQVPKQ